MRIALVVHSGRPDSVAAAADAERMLADLAVDVVTTVDGETSVADVDLMISFGGDGTFLRAAHLARAVDVPVLGVNLGRLGFLAEVEVDDLEPALHAVAAGRFEVELRPTLSMLVHASDGRILADGWALNEVAIEKSARQRLLLMDVQVGGTLFARVPADALVVATATGSTAYALSAGGPILSPQVAATLVVPVAPHTLFDRTLVAGPGEQIRVEVVADQKPAVVSCDGREPVIVEPGGVITAVGADQPVRLARVGQLDFYALVRRKFGLR